MMSSVNYAKLKTNLSLSIQRLKLLEKKKTELAQKSRKEIADYISDGKVERAKIRVEHIIREDYLVEAMEIVEMYCDLLLARFGMIQHMKTLDDGLEEAISSLIWVAPRMQTDVKELKTIADLFSAKYGKQFAQACRENTLKSVNEKLMVKLGVQAPPKILVEKYLIEIAKTLNVPYEPDQEVLMEDEKYSHGGPGSSSGSIGGGGGMAMPLPLIDLGPVPVPPPLPMMPPAGPWPAEPTDDTGKKPPIGFNLDPPSGQMPPSDPVPPPYESVVGKPSGLSPSAPNSEHDQSGESSNANQLAENFNHLHLPSVPDLPEIPSEEFEDKTTQAGDGGNQTDLDFDNLRRRFDELKKKK